MPAKVIPDYKVKQMLRAGKSHREIVEALEREDNIRVTPQAISAWAKRNGYELQERNRTGYPWRVAPEHKDMLPVRAIQWYGRRERGEALPASAERRLDAVIEKLAETDSVFYYDPETIEGWWTVHRQDGDHPLYRDLDVNGPL